MDLTLSFPYLNKQIKRGRGCNGEATLKQLVPFVNFFITFSDPHIATELWPCYNRQVKRDHVVQYFGKCPVNL